jgi:hypothetical protein
MSILPNKIIDQARTQDTRHYPEVRPHNKGALLPVEEPTKGRVFFNPNPLQPDHQGQMVHFSNLLATAGNTNFLRSSTNLETPKQPQPLKNPRVSRTTIPHKRCLQQAQEMRMRGERKTKSESTSTNLTPKGPFDRFDSRASLGVRG